MKDLARNIAELKERVATNQLRYYRPYPKQADFHNAGSEYPERLLTAGNQLGKTLAGGYEMAMHLTGKYPAWWKGKRFDRPVRAWIGGETGKALRDKPQSILLGAPYQWGTGAIPKCDLAGNPRMAHGGVSDLVDTFRVKHVSGGISSASFKSYKEGRENWQSDSVDVMWLDEEPDIGIYTEAFARTTAVNGILYLTFTPLLGMSEVVRRFHLGDSPYRHITRMTIEDVQHISEEERARIIESYPEHERDARTKGVPQLGSGAVFPVAESTIKEEGPEIPSHWARICGLDFGWDHPTAAVWVAWDKDSDTIHVYDCYRQRQEVPAIHASAIKGRGHWIPVAWPHDGLQHDKGSGNQLAEMYRAEGLNMLQEKATFAEGGNGVEAGIMEILERMKTGRFKVAAHLNDWWEEFRMYHRKEGRIVKEADDLMAATRYAMMMLRHAESKVEWQIREREWNRPIEYAKQAWIV